MKNVLKIGKETFTHFYSKNPSSKSAALSYYAFFSMIPVVLLVIGITSFFFSKDIVESNVLTSINTYVGPSIGDFIKSIIQGQTPSTTGAAALISFGVLVFGAIGVFSELNNSLDDIWGQPKKVRGEKPTLSQRLKKMISDRLPLLTFIPLISILLISSIIFHVFLQSIGTYSPFLANEFIVLFKILDPIFSFTLIVILVAFIYRLLPDTKLPWKELIVGASVTSALFLVGELFVTFYIGRESTDSLFGTASAITALLLWVYYSAYIFFFGASFTIVYSKKHGYLKEKESTS